MKLYSIILALVACVPVTRARAPQRIVGGLRADEGQFPALVSMSTDYWGHFCGGSIVTEWHILTAAHCVAKLSSKDIDAMYIRAGSVSHKYGGRVYEVDDVFYHEGYRPNANLSPYDVAIVKVSSPIIFDEFTQPIRLATYLPPAGALVKVAGWGRLRVDMSASSEHQYAVMMTHISHSDCKKFYPTRALNGEVCVASKDGTGSCRGDSGGPLIFDDLLIGISSWGPKQCGYGQPDVFTSVPEYLEWIRKMVQY